jgi:YNFM family putative membrane transporter
MEIGAPAMPKEEILEIAKARWLVCGTDATAQDSSRSRFGTLAALFIAGLSTFVNLYATQPLLPRLREIFGAGELLVSLTVSAPVLAVALTAPVIGLFADSAGRKRVIVASMLLLALPTGLTAISSNLLQFIMWRFLQGLFIPGIIAVSIAYISEESPTHLVGSTMSTYVTGTVTGGFAGRFLTGLIAAHWGWRLPFVALAALTLAGALATWALLPRSSRFVRQKSVTGSIASLGRHLHNPQLLATYAVGFNVLFCMVAAFTYVNFYLAAAPFHLGPSALGSIFAVYLIGAVVTPMAGRILDRIGYRLALEGGAGLVAAGILVTLIHPLALIVAGLAMTATGVFICQAAASSNIGKAAKTARASAAGVYVALYYLGGCAGSIFPGFFWERGGWFACAVMIIAVQLVTIIIANRLWKD